MCFSHKVFHFYQWHHHTADFRDTEPFFFLALLNYPETKPYWFQFLHWNNGHLYMFFYFSYYLYYLNSNPCCNMPELIGLSSNYFLFYNFSIIFVLTAQSHQTSYMLFWPHCFPTHKTLRTLNWTKDKLLCS